MNPIEIEEQLSKLAGEPFDAAEFPFQFLECYGRKAGEIKSLKQGKSNKSDIDGVLQRNNIHIAVAGAGEVDDALTSLRNSKATTKNKAHFILATDGENVAAENLKTGDHLACDFRKIGEEFTFFLPLAGIYFTAEIKNQDIDVKATARLNKLYMELLKENPDWSTAERRHDLNQFMARLIFCFFAEDTDIFIGSDLFTTTLKQMSDSRSGNVTEIIAALFKAMDTAIEDRDSEVIRPWANVFPYVNGGLFGGNQDVPKFSRIARSYLIAAGELNWSKINPDIFGSMIQAVADKDERGSLGMHYTSVPNILKVLNPLFLDDLREQLEKAGDNGRKLLNLRKRIANIRVFDPACGSGNFLVIAYKELRKIEAEILDRRGDKNRNTVINLENFYGIEIKDFAAQIAQIALLIAEFQCDVLYIDQVQACKNMLPLDKANNIVIGNALRLDWLEVCPPTAPVDIVKEVDDDLFATPLEQTEINLDEENLGGETYICGNPPYKGSQTQDKSQKEDLSIAFKSQSISTRQLDYVAGWFLKSASYLEHVNSKAALVSTNSICQGRIVPIIWPLLQHIGVQIEFAHTSFKWKNLASLNAGVTVVIIGLSRHASSPRLYSETSDGKTEERFVKIINPYLVPIDTDVVEKRQSPLSFDYSMSFGNMPIDGGNLLFSREGVNSLGLTIKDKDKFIRRIYGSLEFIKGVERYCLWIEDQDLPEARLIDPITERIRAVKKMRLSSRDKGTQSMAENAHQFREMKRAQHAMIVVPAVSSEGREYLPCGYLSGDHVISNRNFALYDAPIWHMGVIVSKLHLIWVSTVCGKLETRFNYSNTIGWNTFPVPDLNDEDKLALTKCAEDILLARAAHFPKTISGLYKPEDMPDDLRAAHERNDETLERIYIGRRFKTDTERLETLFDLYTKMTSKPQKKAKRA
ncbi:BREX-1 system adenine-specific DNA-methyltransferase PglX [Hellea sp.]|nr:BREX-1 system adenine-specific DNA-methyltransferase PglX [Hellea sp.]